MHKDFMFSNAWQKFKVLHHICHDHKFYISYERENLKVVAIFIQYINKYDIIVNYYYS
jgi:hypothetical protein